MWLQGSLHRIRAAADEGVLSDNKALRRLTNRTIRQPTRQYHKPSMHIFRGRAAINAVCQSCHISEIFSASQSGRKMRILGETWQMCPELNMNRT